MGPGFTRKYGVLLVTGTTAVRIPMIKRGVVDYAVGADWTPATGDCKVLIDGTAAANVANLPTAVAAGNTALWEFVLTAAELTGKQIVVTISDSATKAVEDNAFIVETFGNASAMYPVDFSSATAFITAVNGLAPPTAWNTDVVQSGDSYPFGSRTVCRGTVGSASLTTTTLTPSALTPAGIVQDQFKGRLIVFDIATATAALRGQMTDITGSSAASLPLLTFTALTTAPSAGDTFSIL